MYDMLRRGAFGNTARHWTSFQAMMADPYDGGVGARLHTIGKPWRKYRVPKAALAAEVRKRGWEFNENVEYYESPPDDFRVIQGELTCVPGGLYLHYTWAPGPMRLALEAQELHAFGVHATLILRQYVDPAGLDWLLELLERYDGATVEFTTFSVPAGHLQQQTLIWEVRHY